MVGFGGVGQAITRRLVPFEVTMTALARTARSETFEGLGEIAVHGIDELPTLLPDAEIVLLSLSGNAHTHHLIDAEIIARMAPDALQVNVGRGPLIDTDALVTALHEGRIRAASDVFEQELLPADHPLWSAPTWSSRRTAAVRRRR